jgi:acyl carrier protein
MDKIKEKVKHFVDENFLFTSKVDSIGDDVSFMESGIVDSTGILEIVNFIEEDFGIQLEDDEIIPGNLDSVNLLTRFIFKKSASIITSN